jgi:hypothetical protein
MKTSKYIYMKGKEVPFNILKGLTIKKIHQPADAIYFETENGRKFCMFHVQDCCESVEIESITGDVNDLLDTPILVAEVSSNHENPKESHDNSWTWTFYKLATVKGWVDIRWYGESNGYYSEEVYFYEYTDTETE